MVKISERESELIYIIKAIAIICVVSAHCTTVKPDCGIVTLISARIINSFGSFGVPVFFILAGYLFYRTESWKKDTASFFLTKFVNLCIPWFCAATSIYIYEAIRKGGSVKLYFFSLIGYGSSFWYMSILLLIFVVYYFISKKIGNNDMVHAVLSLLSIISFILRGIEVIPQNQLTVYLNPFNWCIYFSIGGIIEKYRVIQSFINRTWMLFGIIIGFVFDYSICSEIKISYWSWCFSPIAILFSFFVFGFANSIPAKKTIVQIGKASYFIFLYSELLWCGLIVYLGNIIDLGPVVIMRPFLVVAICMIELQLFIVLLKKLKWSYLIPYITGYKST